MNRQQWKEDRRKHIGASESAAVLGVSPWASPLDVWADKLGLLDDSEETEAMQWGTILEPVILAQFTKRTGLVVVRHDQTVTIPHPLGLPMGCTPDAYLGADALVEVKAPAAWAADEWSDGVPLWYQVQGQHQLCVTGRERVYFVALVGGQQLLYREPYIIERNQGFIDALEAQLTAFWRDYVEPRVEPSIEPSAAGVRALERLHPQDSGAEVMLGDEFIDLDGRLERVKQDMKALKGERDDIENRIKAAIGAATYGRLPGAAGRYSWKTQSRTEHLVKASTSRVLRRHSR